MITFIKLVEEPITEVKETKEAPEDTPAAQEEEDDVLDSWDAEPDEEPVRGQVLGAPRVRIKE